VNSILIVAALWAAVMAGIITVRTDGRRLLMPWVTVMLAVIVTVVSVVGELIPAVLAALGRDRELLLAGEWWRAATPLVVQDGGWAGLVFNVIALVAVGSIVESRYRRWMVPLVFVLVGLVGELAAYTLYAGQGFAGNSVANLGLAGVLVVGGLFSSDVRARILAVIGLAAGTVLLALGDLHAVGMVAGSAIGLTIEVSARVRAVVRAVVRAGDERASG
jgi:membrane associated rhomboid family serine protease